VRNGITVHGLKRDKKGGHWDYLSGRGIIKVGRGITVHGLKRSNKGGSLIIRTGVYVPCAG
jgi:hypothetical protein